MIQTNFTQKSSPFFRMLSDDQVYELVRAVFDVMDKVGFGPAPVSGSLRKKGRWSRRMGQGP
jgi:hypothetical protein